MQSPSAREPSGDIAERTRRLHEAYEHLASIQQCTLDLADVRVGRAWSADEHDQYLAMLSAERQALRRYRAARAAFDAARRSFWPRDRL
jgi:hypothetical protein